MHQHELPTCRPSWLRALTTSTGALVVAAGVLAANVGASTTAYASAPAPGALAAPLPQVNPAITGFSPQSVSYISVSQGWVLGTTPCGSKRCLALLHTTNDGASWSVVHVPPAGPQPGGGPELSVRFADGEDGWIFSTLPGEGPELGWSTHNGGQHWAALHFPVSAGPGGVGIEDIEAAGGVADAAVEIGPNVDIFSSLAAGGTWRRTGGPFEVGAGPVPYGQIVLEGKSGWFLENDRVVVSGAIEQPSGKWSNWAPPCSKAGGPATLSAVSSSHIVAVCTEGVWTGTKVTVDLLKSPNGGHSFGPGHLLPFASVGTVAAAGSSALAIGITVAHANSVDNRLEMSFNGGTSWQPVYSHAGAGWASLAFTTPDQGIALLDADSGHLNIVLSTSDGGRHWSPVSF